MNSEVNDFNQRFEPLPLRIDFEVRIKVALLVVANVLV